MPSAVGQARPLRWLVVAPFSAPPTGRPAMVSGERFTTLMKKIGPKATVELPEGLGATARGSVTLEFSRPRDFRLAEVIKRIDVLAKLSTIASDLSKGGSLKAALGKVRTTVGEGFLLQSVEAMADGSAQPAPAAESAPAAASPEPASSESAPKSESASESSGGGGSALDSIFGKADLAPKPEADVTSAAKSGLDAFIGAMRKSGGTNKTSTKSKPAAREIAAFIQHAAETTAIALMSLPACAALERAWRGLHTIVGASPGADDLAIDLLDSGPAELVEQLQRRLDADPMERPDAVFVAFPVDSVDTLAALAQLGASRSVPVVTEADDSLSGASFEDGEVAAEPEAWAQLRARPESQWLSVTSNSVVLANEQLDDMQRTVFGSSVVAVAAMLSASVGQTGGPGQIYGRAGALVSPASYRVVGDDAATSLTTERDASVDEQRALARRGVLVVGGERGHDRLRLAAAPTVSATDGDAQLPGRILAGRAARFARAIRDELPPHATEQEVAARMNEAATNFLPRGDRGAVALSVRTDADGTVGVDASIGASLAGAAFKFSSDL